MPNEPLTTHTKYAKMLKNRRSVMNKRTKSYTVTLKPRTRQQTNKPTHKFNPGTIRYDVLCGLQLNAQHNDEPLFDKPVHVEITFYFAIANDVQKRKHKPEDPHISSPYLSNLLSFLLDIMNTTIISQHSVINSLDVKKRYGKVAMTKITIREI